jgi:hypothetical protein
VWPVSTGSGSGPTHWVVVLNERSTFSSRRNRRFTQKTSSPGRRISGRLSRSRRSEFRESQAARLRLGGLFRGEVAVRFDLIFEGVLFHPARVALRFRRTLSVVDDGLIQVGRFIRQKNVPLLLGFSKRARSGGDFLVYFGIFSKIISGHAAWRRTRCQLS